MENCFMMRSSPALAMQARLKWLMKHSAMSIARMGQRLGEDSDGAESGGGIMKIKGAVRLAIPRSRTRQ